MTDVVGGEKYMQVKGFHFSIKYITREARNVVSKEVEFLLRKNLDCEGMWWQHLV